VSTTFTLPDEDALAAAASTQIDAIAKFHTCRNAVNARMKAALTKQGDALNGVDQKVYLLPWRQEQRYAPASSSQTRAQCLLLRPGVPHSAGEGMPDALQYTLPNQPLPQLSHWRRLRGRGSQQVGRSGGRFSSRRDSASTCALAERQLRHRRCDDGCSRCILRHHPSQRHDTLCAGAAVASHSPGGCFIFVPAPSHPCPRLPLPLRSPASPQRWDRASLRCGCHRKPRSTPRPCACAWARPPPCVCWTRAPPWRPHDSEALPASRQRRTRRPARRMARFLLQLSPGTQTASEAAVRLTWRRCR